MSNNDAEVSAEGTPLGVLQLETRTRNALTRSGYNSIEEVLDLTVEELFWIRNFGSNSYKDLVERLVAMGYLPEDTIRYVEPRRDAHLRKVAGATKLGEFKRTLLGSKTAEQNGPNNSNAEELLNALAEAKQELRAAEKEHDRVIKDLELLHDPSALQTKESVLKRLVTARQAVENARAAIEAATDPNSNQSPA